MLGIFRVSGSPLNDFSRRLAFTLSSTIVNCIWTARVKHRSCGDKPNFTQLHSMIKNQIIDIVKHKFRLLKHCKSMAEFKARFAINNSICSVNASNELIIHI